MTSPKRPVPPNGLENLLRGLRPRRCAIESDCDVRIENLLRGLRLRISDRRSTRRYGENLLRGLRHNRVYTPHYINPNRKTS